VAAVYLFKNSSCIIQRKPQKNMDPRNYVNCNNKMVGVVHSRGKITTGMRWISQSFLRKKKHWFVIVELILLSLFIFFMMIDLLLILFTCLTDGGFLVIQIQKAAFIPVGMASVF